MKKNKKVLICAAGGEPLRRALKNVCFLDETVLYRKSPGTGLNLGSLGLKSLGAAPTFTSFEYTGKESFSVGENHFL